MNILIKGGNVYTKDGFQKKDIGIVSGRISFNTEAKAYGCWW